MTTPTRAPFIQTGPGGIPTQTGFITAGRAYIERWTAWMQANTDADPAIIAALMAAGDPPPDIETAVTDSAVAKWETSHPVASRIYWTVRAALEETDGGRRAHHHRVAVYFIHYSFPSLPDRQRLGLPKTARELADLLGVSDRVLRSYREKNLEIFETTSQTLQSAFLDHYYGPVYEAMGVTASTPGKEGTADRRLFVQIKGDLGPSGGADDPAHISVNLSDWRNEQERRRQEAAETLERFNEADNE